MCVFSHSVYFAIKCKNSAGTILQFEHLCSHIRLSSSSNVNIIASMPSVRLCVGSALTISFGLACRGYTSDGVLLMYFFKKFQV